MYVLLLIFGSVGGDPALAPVIDDGLNPIRYSTLTACQSAAAKWKATASNKVDPDTGLKAIKSTYCMKVQ